MHSPGKGKLLNNERLTSLLFYNLLHYPLSEFAGYVSST